jgi:hypothetical protein
VLAFHDPVDHWTDVVPRGGDDLLGDLLGVELLEEVLRRPDLGDPAVDRQAPIFAAREGTMPCQPIPPIISPGICWSLRGNISASCSSHRARQPLKWTG